MNKKRTILKYKEMLIERLLFLCSLLSIFTTIGIIVILLSETISFFREVSIIEFFTDTQWTPLFVKKHFGILPLLSGTFLTTAIALLVAVPVGGSHYERVFCIHFSDFVNHSALYIAPNFIINTVWLVEYLKINIV